MDGKTRQWELGEHSKAAARDWLQDDVEATEQVWRELLAVERALLELGDKLRGRSVLVCTDATVVARYVNWGVGASRMLSEMKSESLSGCPSDTDSDV